MDNLEKVEKIREKTGVSYEAAKEALEASNYDVLDAIVYLEKQGKVKAPEVQAVIVEETEKQERREKFKKTQDDYEKKCKKKARNYINDFFKWLGALLKKSVDTSFIVERKGENILTMPVLILILFLICLFWLIFPLMIVGLFLDCRYRFEGIHKTQFDINEFCDRCADSAEDLKNSFKKDEEQ